MAKKKIESKEAKPKAVKKDKKGISLSHEAEMMLHKNNQIREGASEESLVKKFTHGDFEMTEEDAQNLMEFRTLLTVAAKIKLDELEFENQILIANTAKENWA